MGTVLNFIRPDKKYENIQANRIAFYRMDESFAEFIHKVEEEFTVLGLEWNSDDPCKIALVLGHEESTEEVQKLDAPQVEKVDAVEAPVQTPVHTEPLPTPRPSYAQRIESFIRKEVTGK